MTVEMGDRVRCRVTGLEGVAVGYVKWLTGCDQVIARPKAKEDNKMPDSFWVDIHAVEVIEKGAVVMAPEVTAPGRGGPSPYAPKVSR